MKMRMNLGEAYVLNTLELYFRLIDMAYKE